MSELQIGLLVIGVLVVGGVLAYNRMQERGVRRETERAFRSGHADVLLDQRAEPAPAGPARIEADLPAAADAGAHAQPDPAVDYIVELSLPQGAARGAFQDAWAAIERRHAHRALLAGSADGTRWRAALQLASLDGALGEAELIEFRSEVETLAAGLGATVSAPEMRAAVQAARELDALCAESDVQVVVHVRGGPFAGTKIRAAAESSGLVLEADGRFALRDGQQRLLYTLAAQDDAAFAAGNLREATPAGLTLALDLARTPEVRRAFESMARLAHQLAALLGGRLADDNDNPLDERALAAIAAQLDAACARLEERGIPSGSAVALRLFS